MTENKDWKRRYEELLQEHESKLTSEAEHSKLLTHTITRLTLAASGLDAQLDPHLKGIRDAVRDGVSPSLKEKLDTLSDSLMRLSDETESAGQSIDTFSTQLASLMHLSKRDTKEVARLFKSLQSHPAHAGDEDLNRLAGLLQPDVSMAGAKKAGLFGKFLATNPPASSEAVNSTNRILLNLLDQANWPGHWGAEITQLKIRLTSKPADNEWMLVLEDLLDLSAKSYGEAKAEIKEAEDFLGELTQRLLDIDEHLRKVHDGRSEVVEHSRILSEEVTSQVGGLYTTVSSATDLGQLKRDINERLNGIQQTMGVFLQEEQQWYERAESNEHQLRERLNKLEKESKDLHHRLLEAHHLALRDAVTELPNRLAYDERVEQEFARWKRFAEPLSMLVWDVDDFKLINDRFGHQAGDKVLRTIAKSLQQRLRETDFIARYGGEEFVTLLCGAEGEKTLKVAEQMRQSVEQSGFHSGDKAVNVTISCGISHFTEGDSVETVFKRADNALYQAKRNGKNRCEIG